MSDRDRGARFKVVTALAAAIIALLMTIGFFDSGRQYGEAIAKKSANSQTYSTNAEQEIRSTCLRLDGTAQAECIRRVVETANEHQRAEKDLVAQTEMALWAFWMLIVTALMAAITAVGVFYVWRTLLATQDMARETTRIGEAQVKAYLSVESVKGILHTVEKDPFIEILITVKNSGQSPALDVKVGVDGKVFARHNHKDGFGDIPSNATSERRLLRSLNAPLVVDRLGRVNFMIDVNVFFEDVFSTGYNSNKICNSQAPC
ncbi:hypothetical protein [Roseovarius tolerans]|uniref:hypothetical protein n=1 Tax=Roseovarius tolerans TaxID=74031 RepID=UPI00237E162E|nr:hypothetical protein [Roseovarius tolerans]